MLLYCCIVVLFLFFPLKLSYNLLAQRKNKAILLTSVEKWPRLKATQKIAYQTKSTFWPLQFPNRESHFNENDKQLQLSNCFVVILFIYYTVADTAYDLN